MLGVIQSGINFVKTPNTPSGISTLPDTAQVGVPITGSYTYFDPSGQLENNEPPYCSHVEISNHVVVGETITATVYGVVIPNGGTPGPHKYSWYRAFNKHQSSEVLITEGTSPGYVIQEADDARFIRCKVTIRQEGVLNTDGMVRSSPYSERINSPTFNPIFDIAWQSAYIRSTLVDFNTTHEWPNSGIESAGPIVQDGVANMPVYDPVEQALRFTASNNERMSLPKDYDTYPIDFWCRFKFASDPPAIAYLFGFNNSTFIRINIPNQFQISGSPALATSIVANQWYVMRIVFNGAASRIELNKSGAPETFTASTVSLGGSGSGRIGCSFNQSSFGDFWLSEQFAIKGELSPANADLMWGSFGF